MLSRVSGLFTRKKKINPEYFHESSDYMNKTVYQNPTYNKLIKKLLRKPYDKLDNYAQLTIYMNTNSFKDIELTSIYNRKEDLKTLDSHKYKFIYMFYLSPFSDEIGKEYGIYSYRQFLEMLKDPEDFLFKENSLIQTTNIELLNRNCKNAISNEISKYESYLVDLKVSKKPTAATATSARRRTWRFTQKKGGKRRRQRPRKK